MDRLYRIDKRIYAFALILFMILILLIYFITSNKDDTIVIGHPGTISENNDKIQVVLEESVSQEELDRIKKDVEDQTGKQTDVYIAAPYDDSQENLDIINQKANTPEDKSVEEFYGLNGKD